MIRTRPLYATAAVLGLGVALALAGVAGSGHAQAPGTEPGPGQGEPDEAPVPPSPVVPPSQAVLPGDDAVVATVGDVQITAGQVRRRMAKMPPYQLAELGSTPDEVRKAFVEHIYVPEVLLAEEARARGLDARPELRDRIVAILRTRVVDDAQRKAFEENPITMEDVQAYYDENQGEYATPERIAIWRILAASEADARKVLQEAKAELTTETWNRLARDHSIDKETNMRGGNLGLVAPDGRLSQGGRQVDPALFEAAAAVEDMELVAEPVQEGPGFAVIWRRKGMRGVTRGLAEEAPGIRQILARERAMGAVIALVKRLREEHLTEYAAALVDQIEVLPEQAPTKGRRPGSLPKSRSRADAEPEKDSVGYR